MNTCIDINGIDLTQQDELYRLIEDKFFSQLEDDFSKKNSLVKVDFNGDSKDFRLNDFMLALILIPPLAHIKKDITFDDFPIDSNIDKRKLINKHFSKCTQISCDLDNETQQCVLKSIIKSLTFLAKITWKTNRIYGTSVNIKDIITLCKEVEYVRDLINFEVDENKQFSEIVDEIQEVNKYLIDILTKEKTCFTTLISTIDKNQFQEVFTNIGLKPDSNGNLIPKVVNTSLYRGLKDPNDFYIMALGARKALITNAVFVSRAGYLGRKLVLLMINTQLEKGVDDCGTQEFLSYYIKDKDFYNRFINKYVRLEGSNDEFLPLLQEDIDSGKYLNKTIEVRSPLTCKLGHDKKCKKCYGYQEKYTNFHIGGVTGILLAHQIIQRLLSTKHTNFVVIDAVQLPPGSEKYFRVEKDRIISNTSFKMVLEDVDEFDNLNVVNSLTINDEHFDFSDFNVYFDGIKDRVNDLKEVVVDSDEELFTFTLENNEINKSLRHLIKILESKDELSNIDRIESLVEKMMTLIIDSNLICSISEIELIVDKMIRDINNLNIRPQSVRHGFTILGVPKAILHSNSIIESLSFEKLQQTFETRIFDKNGDSVMDILFGLEDNER